MRAELALAQFPFVARLGAAAQRELGALPLSRARPRQLLLRRGQADGGAYFVTRGALRVHYVTPEGRDATLYHVEPGATCVLSLGAAFADEPYPAWVDAGADGARFVRVPGPLFRRLVDGEAAFRELVFSALSGRLLELMCTLEDLGSRRIEQRVARHLLRRLGPDQSIRATQAAIASDLGTAREVVSRALRDLVRRGIVRTRRGRIEVCDADALARASS